MGLTVLVSFPYQYSYIAPENLHSRSYNNYVDIDECTTGACGPNAECTNTFGSFNCMCNQGYSGDEVGCVGELSYSQLANNYG